MPRSYLVAVLAATLVLPALGAAPQTPKKKEKGAKKAALMLTAEERAVIEATNAERKKEELAPLKPSPELTEAARAHARNMASQSKLAHELDDKTPADRVRATGYAARRSGENVAWNTRTPQATVAGWMNSPGHRKNILNGGFTEIGVGVALNDKGQPYWCQVFGTPR